MKQNLSELNAKYRRRAFLITSVMAISLTGGVLPLVAQDATPVPTTAPAPQTPPAPAGGAQTDPNAGSTLHIVPVPRKTKPPTRGTVTIQPDGKVNTDAAAPPAPGADSGGFGLPDVGGGAQGTAGQGSGAGRFGRGSRGAGTPFSFDFHGSDIINVLTFFAHMSNLTITADSSLSGQVTIINPNPVTLDQAFEILQSVLHARGFTAQQNGAVLQIVPFATATKSTPIISGDPEGNKLDPRDQVMTQVIPLDNVDADALAKDLQPLISTGASLIGSNGTNALILTDTSSNIRRFIDLVSVLDKSSTSSEIAIYQLKRAEATNIAQIINDLYKQTTTRGRPTTGGQPGQPGFNPGNPAAAQASQASRPSVVAEADPRTNSVIVVASRDKQEEITKNIINRLDDDDTNSLEEETIKVKYADATMISDTINTVLNNMHAAAATGSSGGTSFQGRAFGGGGFLGALFGAGGGSSQSGSVQSNDPFAKVVGDLRTNTLFVTASADKMVKIKELVRQLDQPIHTETTTFVVALKNAQAQDIATALGLAFGTSQSTSSQNLSAGYGGQSGQRNGASSTSGAGGSGGNNGLSRTSINRSVGRGVSPPPPPSPDLGVGIDPSAEGGSAVPSGVSGVMTPGGFVPTETGQDLTRQFGGGGGNRGGGGFGGGGFGGGNRGGGANNQQGSLTTGQGTDGSFVNYLQLQNNVIVTPSPGGDSVIVSTTPNNIDAVRKIIEQLDVVPRQVMIECVVAEVSLTTDQKFGVSGNDIMGRLFGSTSGAAQLGLSAAGYNTGTAGTALDPLGSGFQFALSNSNYTAVLQAMDTNDRVHILATPKVFTSNNQEAVIDIQTQVPYITGQQLSGLVATTATNQVQFQGVGFSLDVTPRITREGLVTIDVTSDASELQGYQTLGVGANAIQAPEFDDRYTDTEVTVKDSETVVIGGLIQDRSESNVSKVPILGDLPLIGQIFRSREKSRTKVELVIFLTPHVVNSVEEARELSMKAARPVMNQIPDARVQMPSLLAPGEPGQPPLPKATKNAKPITQPAPGAGATTPATPANPTTPAGGPGSSPLLLPDLSK